MKTEIFFDMTRLSHPITGSSTMLLKRWSRHSIYAKSGYYNHTENLNDNKYASSSIYLYDYVVVNTSLTGSNPSFTGSVGDEVYFEVSYGYPRNHFTHKRELFSLYNLVSLGEQNGVEISGSYRRNQQTMATTIGEDGITDSSLPVQTLQVSNINLVQGSNAINS